MVIGQGGADRVLSENEVRGIVERAFDEWDVAGRRVLCIVPDGTRSAPIPLMFRLFQEIIGEQVAALDYLIALGTHPPMSEPQIERFFGLMEQGAPVRSAGVRGAGVSACGLPACARIYNHEWDNPALLKQIGTIPAAEVEALTGGRMSMEVPVTINRRVFDYDQIIICGPTFPHEVVGFSGGNKYFFPGIAGAEVIHFTHWLGALLTCGEIIGVKHTPVRAMIDRAASLIRLPKFCFSMVVRGHADLVGLYCGAPEEAYEAAADLSAQVHIVTVRRPFERALAVMPEMYDDLWTAAKGMYKLEPAIADGGEVIIYAPHIREVSYTHGRLLDAIGYHVRDYFLKQWERFKDYPWGVLAHSTHLRGAGVYENGVERPRIRVTLATGIPRERCERLGLGYLDPAAVNPDDWRGREDEGVLLVPRAGEILYRLEEQT